MKKLFTFLLTVLIGLNCLTLSAQNTLTVADGTETNNYIPIYGLWADENQHNQVIYPGSMLGDMTGGSITEVKFYLSNPPYSPWNNSYVVSMGITSADNFTANVHDNSSVTQVCTGTLNAQNNEITFTFNSPYLYAGGNLLFDITLQASSYSGGSFYGISSLGGSIYNYSSYTYTQDFIPKTTFTFSGGATCLTPNQLKVTNVTSSSATVSWHQSSAGTGMVALAPYGTAVDNLTWTSVTDTTYTFSGLDAGEHYTFYVKTDCGGGDVSPVAYRSFYTYCEAETNFPWFENFEDSWVSIVAFGQERNAPECWKVFHGGSGVNTWTRMTDSYYVYEGSACAAYYTYGGSNHNEWLVSPLLNITGDMTLSFFAASSSEYYPAEEISVWISGDNQALTAPASDTAALPGFTQIANFPSLPLEWYMYEVPLTGYTGDRYIAFVRKNNTYGNYLLLDNVKVDESPSCQRPSALASDSTGADFAVLSWVSDASEFNVYYRYEGDLAFSEVNNVTLGPDSTYTLTGLVSGQAYEWYVAAICDGDTLASNVTLPLGTFNTACVPATVLPMSWDFASNINGGTANCPLPACWSRPDANYPYVYEAFDYTTYNYNGVLACGDFDYSGPMYDGTPKIAVLPELDNTISISNLQMELDAYTDYNNSAAAYPTVIMVGVMTDPTDASTFVAVDTLTGIYSSATNFVVTFSNYSGTGNFVALRMDPGKYYDDWDGQYLDNALYVDNMSLSLIPSCPRPEAVTVSNVASDGAMLTWTSQEDAFMVYYRVHGTSAYTGITDGPVTDTFYTLTGLLPSTLYDVYVSSVCYDETETPSLPTSFTTQCVALDSLPYFCDFEIDNGGIYVSYPLPDCWTRGNLNTMYPYCYNYDYYAYSGYYSLGMYGYNTAALPAVNTTETPISDLMLSFYARYWSDAYPCTVQVGVMTDPTDPATFVQVGSDISISATQTQYEVSLATYQGTGEYVAFRLAGTDPEAYIDNVLLDLLPDCQRPTVFSANIGVDEATISWNANADQSEWEVAVGNAGNDPDTLASTLVYSNSYSLQNLAPNTSYTVFVRTICGVDMSDWSDGYTFTTLLTLPAEMPYACNFEDTLENANWTLVNGSTPNKWYIDTAANNTANGQYGLYISKDNGASNTYDGSVNTVVWAYRDIQFYDAAEFVLSFDWKCFGESSYDYMKVFIGAPVTVSAGNDTKPVGTTQIGTLFNEQLTWQTEVVTLGSEYANTTKRLYFMWRNDYSVTNDPAAAVDNVSVTAATCARPVSLTLVDNSVGSATIGISPASEYDALWEVSLNDSLITVTDTLPVFNVVPGTEYEVLVRTICDGGDTSVWSLPLNFVSECQMLSSVPQTWNFENNLIGTDYPMPVCWSKISPSGYPYPYIYTDYYDNFAHSGTHSLYFYNYYGTGYAIMPALDVDVLNIQDLELSFYAYTNNYSGMSSLQVGVMTDPSVASTFTLVQTVPVPNSYGNDPIVVSLASYTGTGAYIAFRNVDPTSSYTQYVIDDLTLEEIPSCLPPTAVSVSAITETTATVSWTENNSATTWNIRYYEAGDDENDTVITVTTNPYTVTNLTPGTAYILQVMSSCSATDSSTWATAPIFTTECAAVTVFPYTEGFEGGEFGCWTATTVLGNNPWLITSYPVHGGSYATGMYYYVNTISHLVSPVFDLTGVTNPTLSFYYNLEAYLGVVDTFAVYYRTSSTTDWVRIDGFNTVTNGFEADTLALPNPSATYQIAFFGYGVDGNSIYLDDIKVFSMPNDTTPVTNPTVATNAASAVGQTTATLNAAITNPDNVTITAKGFQWKATTGGTYTSVSGTGTGNTFTADLTNLTPNTSYTFKAFITFNGTTVEGSEMTFTTQGGDTPEPCDVPTGLHTTDIQNESISIAWDANPNVNSWNVQYRLANGSWNSASATTNSYTITGLTGNKDYEIQVQAVCADGTSDWSASITAHTTNVGIENWLENNVTLFPNPAKEVVNVQCTMNNVQSVEVFDVFGKLITTTNDIDNPIRINVSGLADGMYFVRVTTEAGVVTKQFVKK